MSKRVVILAGVALAVALLGAALVVPTLAQEPAPTPKVYGWRGGGRGFGRGPFGQAGLEAAAEALGMTADELSTQLWGGRSLADLAEKYGKDLQTLRDAVEDAQEVERQEALAAHREALRNAINQALENGDISQEQHDWLLEGLEQGFMLGRWGFGRGFGFGHGMRGRFGGFAPFGPPLAAPSSSS